jgi:hypothetical protein
VTVIARRPTGPTKQSPGCRGLHPRLAMTVIATLSACATAAQAPAKSEDASTYRSAPSTEAPREPTAPDRSAESIGLRLEVLPADAQVLLDGKAIGLAQQIAAGGIVKVDPGIHQITVRRTGYETWRTELAVRDGVESIHVDLVPVAAP